MSIETFQPETGNLSQKELKDSDLILIHKELFRKLINEKLEDLHQKNIAHQMYDARINTENIRLFYNHHITIFAWHLLNDELDQIVKHNTF